MRIVHVAPDFYPVPPSNYGGIERMIFSLIEESVKYGHEVFLYAHKDSKTSATLIPYQHGFGNPQQIAEFVKETLPDHIDIIHDHTHLSVIGRQKLHIPTICTIHDSLNNDIEFPVYLSKRALEFIGENKGFFIYNGIDLKEYEVTVEKDDYLLFLGVLNWHKGIHHALDIAEKTKQKLIIAGPIFNWEYFHSHVEQRIAMMENVEYIGEVGGKERLNLLQKAKCLLFPTSWEEPFGLVMVEAMACGTPVVALKNGAVPEVLNGFADMICETTDEMAVRLQRPFPDPYQLREYVSVRFSKETMTNNYLSLYEKVLNKKKKENIPNIFQFSDLYEKANRYKELQIDEAARHCFNQLLSSDDASIEEKLAACDQAADMYYQLGNDEMEREFIYKSFEFDTPRAEFCCRLGYQFLQRNKIDQAIYWYTQATKLTQPQNPGKFYYEACWTWLPYIQLCICYFKKGEYALSYQCNEQARLLNPDYENIINNKKLLEDLLLPSPSVEETEFIETNLNNIDGMPFKMRLQTPGLIEETLIHSGSWEPNLVGFLRPFLTEGDLVLDIGANIGYHSLHFASLLPKVDCISFEPHPIIYEQLTDNIRINQFSNINAYQVAVGDVSGTTSFFMQDEKAYNRGMSAIEYYQGIGAEFTKIEVKKIAIDDFLSKEMQKRVKIIKIDTQGFEYQVISGAKNTIEKSRPIIIAELHDNTSKDPQNILSILTGYKVFKFQPWSGEICTIDGPDPKDFRDDYLYVPEYLQSAFYRIAVGGQLSTLR